MSTPDRSRRSRPPRTSRGVLFLVVVVVASTFAVGIAFAFTIKGGSPEQLPILARPAGTAADAVVFGDSVVAQSGLAIAGALKPESAARMVSYPGIRTDQLLPMMRKEIQRRVKEAAPFDQAAYLIGYNDVMQNMIDNPALDQLLTEAEHFRCNVWLTLPTSDGGHTGPAVKIDAAKAAEWNKRLAERVARHPKFRLITAWQNQVEADGAATLLQADGVHPTPAGRAALAQVIDTALTENCN